ncbi:hypothetical protein ONZ45_g2697 [Pleurotus djamor]|nr:hypothetical protein ONZ45_g2697 [Pleurotus djamor]
MNVLGSRTTSSTGTSPASSRGSYRTAPTSPNVSGGNHDELQGIPPLPNLGGISASVADSLRNQDATLVVPSSSVSRTDDVKIRRRRGGLPDAQTRRGLALSIEEGTKPTPVDPWHSEPNPPRQHVVSNVDEDREDLFVLRLGSIPTSFLMTCASRAIDSIGEIGQKVVDASASSVQEIHVVGDGIGERPPVNKPVTIWLSKFPALRSLTFKNVEITSHLLNALADYKKDDSDFCWKDITLENCASPRRRRGDNARLIRTASLTFGTSWDPSDDPSQLLARFQWQGISALKIGSQAVLEKSFYDFLFSDRLTALSDLSIVPPPADLACRWGDLMHKLGNLDHLRFIPVANASLPPLPTGQLLPQLRTFEGPMSVAASYCHQKYITALSLYGDLFDNGCDASQLYPAMHNIYHNSAHPIGLERLELRVPISEKDIFTEIKKLCPLLQTLKITFTDGPEPPTNPVSGIFIPDVVVPDGLCELYIDFRRWYRPEDAPFFCDGKWVIRDLRSQYMGLTKIVYSCASLFALTNYGEVNSEGLADLGERSVSWEHPYQIQFVSGKKTHSEPL